MKTRFSRSFSLFCAFAALSSVHAQVGNNNPTGPSGFFNGNVTTGCSYDPYTGNATRAITDLVVPGAVGAYPLAFSRTSNSRASSSPFVQFGTPGRWRHSYSWSIDGSETSDTSPFVPTVYPVSFPDGRVVSFTYSANDPYFRGPPGVRERFQPLNTSTLLAYLILPDGGKIEFKANPQSVPVECDYELHPPLCTYSYSYSYKVQAIIDPHGLRTVLAYNGDGTLNTITEPAGRWIQLLYMTTTWTNGSGFYDRVIDRINSSDGRSVKYNYARQTFSPGTFAYTSLANVVYFGDSSMTAFYTYVAPNVPTNGNYNGPPLLSTCDDVMYAGPMKRISYTYATTTNGDGSAPVAGQIKSEKSGSNGQTVSTLAVNTSTSRSEVRGDGPSRTFVYTTTGRAQSQTDFKGISASQTYDANFFVNVRTDRNQKNTYFINDPLTGNIKQITYPLTASDIALNKLAATVKFVYGSATCPDPNNRDANNPYHLYSVTDERGFSTIFTRDANKRVTQINFPDGGVETFAYDSRGKITAHRLRTGGLETFTYDARGLLTQYRDAYHLAAVDPYNALVPANATPSLRYTYYTSGPSFDRVQTVTDANGNVATINQYDSRGQIVKMTHPLGQGEVTASNVQTGYDADGAVMWRQDELGHRTSYTYDDYGRAISVTRPPSVAGNPSPPPIRFYYDHTGGTNAADYSHTNNNPTRIVLPSGKMTKVAYDNNLRKTSSTVAGPDGLSEAATTTFTYDNNGNLKTVKDPNGQTNGLSTQYFYDARNRLTDIDDPMVNDATTPHRNSNLHTTSWILDQSGNRVSQKNANNQLITFDSYDQMNRLLQQTVPQNPNPAAVTKYTYYPSGLLKTMKDPLLAGTSYSYTHTYDLMGRKTRQDYPPDPLGTVRSESIVYDTVGRIQTYTNRAGAVQTFTYDGRNRQTGSTWSDGTTAPSMTYDPASRVTQISNADAVIKNIYFDDNTLKSQEEWATAAPSYHRTVTYAYDADGNRGNIIYPSGKNYSYGYYGRNDLWYVLDNLTGLYQATYIYDLNGNMTTRYVGSNWIVTDAAQRNPMNQIKHLEHRFGGTTPAPTTRTFDYTYNSMGSRTSIKRDGGTPESYGYDLAQQVTAGVESGSVATYDYDANGNRIFLNDAGTYDMNNLNQHTIFHGQTVGHDTKGNVTNYGSTATYLYDAQNRLRNVTTGGVTTVFKYDGLNRKISQTIGGVTTYNVWDGWNLIEERSASNAVLHSYLYGAGEIVERITGATKRFYFQDGLGSTSHFAEEAGTLLESYKYGTFGQQTVYAPNGTVRTGGTLYDIRHLFTGQLWMPQAGLYDYRNRAYSPTLTRFLQPDPIGFGSDPTNLYRYCENDPINRSDPSGLGPDPRLNTEDKNSGSLGAWNWGLGRGSGPGSTQGFWSGINGIPTGAPGGGSGPDLGSRLGNGSGGSYTYGFIEAHTDEVSVEGTAVPGAPASFPNGEIGFLPGDISTGSRNSWNRNAVDQTLAVAGLMQTSGAAIIGSTNGASAGLRTSAAGAGIGLFLVGTGWDLYNLRSGHTSLGLAGTNLGFSLYAMTGPYGAATGTGYSLVQSFYPGGWLGNGNNVPFQGAGALADYGYWTEYNQTIVPGWQPREPGY